MIILGTATIVAAAIKCHDKDTGNFIISAPPPFRHHHLLRCFYGLSGEPLRNSGTNQGFLTSTGEFVDRKQAMVIALAANQPLIDHPSRIDVTLFSEDLW
jgi:hypothetical protein